MFIHVCLQVAQGVSIRCGVGTQPASSGVPFNRVGAMGLRNFRDSRGGEWRVWDVVPYGSHPTERRGRERRVAQSGAYPGPERRTRERRMRTPGLMTPGLESGWLCFESAQEKRRLTPIP